VDLDFVILSGDNTSHRRQGLTDEAKRRQVEMFDEILALFNKHLPGVPLFWTLGNYEALPVGHYAPRSTVHDRSLWPSWLYDTFLKVLLKSHTLPLEPAAKKSAKLFGLNFSFRELLNIFRRLFFAIVIVRPCNYCQKTVYFQS
jgi:hypothetical protein